MKLFQSYPTQAAIESKIFNYLPVAASVLAWAASICADM